MKVSMGPSALVAAVVLSPSIAFAEPVELEGTVQEVVGQHLVLDSAQGKVLVDLGPEADGQVAVKAGDKVKIDGDMKKNEMLRADRISVSGGEAFELKKPKQSWWAWMTGKKDKDGPFSAADAKKIATDKGYTLTSDPVSEKKHFVATGTKDGKTYELAIHRDGDVDAEAPFGTAEAKKLATDNGYALTNEPTPEKKHFVATGTKDGKTYELDLHRDGTVKEKIAFSATDAKKLATDKGYEVFGEPKAEKAHFQMLAKKDGKYLAVDAHRDGTVKELRPVDKTDIQWGPMIPQSS